MDRTSPGFVLSGNPTVRGIAAPSALFGKAKPHQSTQSGAEIRTRPHRKILPLSFVQPTGFLCRTGLLGKALLCEHNETGDYQETKK
jgi:hypothetical protein